MSINAKKFTSQTSKGRPYGKALLFTGGAVLAIWAIRKVPWKTVVSADTLESVKETLVSVTARLEDMAKEYVNGPVAEAVGYTKKAAETIANTTATH